MSNRLTSKQKEALNEAPLYFGQGVDNLNLFYWTNATNTKWWQVRTIQILIDKGLLVKKYNRGLIVDDVVYTKEQLLRED